LAGMEEEVEEARGIGCEAEEPERPFLLEKEAPSCFEEDDDAPVLRAPSTLKDALGCEDDAFGC
jgi:hypothetical protein